MGLAAAKPKRFKGTVMEFRELHRFREIWQLDVRLALRHIPTVAANFRFWHKADSDMVQQRSAFGYERTLPVGACQHSGKNLLKIFLDGWGGNIISGTATSTMYGMHACTKINWRWLDV